MELADLKLALIPVIAGLIGYVTNYVAVKLLFWPVTFWGIRLPGLEPLVHLLPRKLQSVPGFAHGGVGWQGIVPSRASKMGSIAVDKGIAKLGSPREFFAKLDPARIADHMVRSSREEIHEIVEEIIRVEHPSLWQDLPPRARREIHAMVDRELPEIAREITEDIGENIDQLLDIKLMVIRRIAREPELANRISQGIGTKELNFIVRSGLYFGFLLGLPQIPIFLALDAWWVLPIGGVTVGYLTNWLALKVIFHPIEPRRIGPVTLQGRFLKRQPEVSRVYSRVISDDIVTLENIGDELMNGPKSDRTRRLIAERLRPAIDRGLGAARMPVRIAVGTSEYDRIREGVARAAVSHTMAPLEDPEFNRAQSEDVYALLVDRMADLPADDFAELLRGAVREDEWMLILLGAQLGFVAGLLQILTLFS